jgi:hypothetical protein
MAADPRALAAAALARAYIVDDYDGIGYEAVCREDLPALAAALTAACERAEAAGGSGRSRRADLVFGPRGLGLHSLRGQ